MNTEAIRSIIWERDYVKFINQKALPGKLEYIYTSDYREIIAAINELKIRGAPLIGISAAYGIALAAKEAFDSNYKDHLVWIDKVIKEFSETRPTAINLFYAIDRVKNIINRHSKVSQKKLYEVLLKEAHKIFEEDELLCKKIGNAGAKLIKNNFKIITHCNTGMLVTAGIGTALGVIYTAKAEGKKVHVYADETRPLLQGSRLTAWECQKNSIPVTVIADNMSAHLMKTKKIDCAIVGADRIASNGDTANKIGTYALALLCKAHNVPFYVAAPFTTFDSSLKSGKNIPIEERNKDEIINFNETMSAPKGVKVFNPAFDVTPAKLITAIITDKGVFRAPYGNWS